MRIFVIGNQDAVLGLALAGVDGRIVTTAQQVAEALDASLADRTIGLLLITSDAAALARERVDALKVSSLEPLVVEVPGPQAEEQPPSLKDMVQRAVGIRLGGR
ncbi:MAG TPA: ATPase [Chloroflexi bacterium]|jgi:V/A-type H+-transporting ATPase subunit F|nr:ATPase [Chloroflexota bacterium]